MFIHLIIGIILFYFFYKKETFENKNKIFYSPNFELSNDIMYGILNKIKDKSKKYNHIQFIEIKELNYDYYSGFIGEKIDTLLIKNIIIEFLSKLNIEIIKGKYDNYFFPLFILIKYFIIKRYKSEYLKKIDFVFDIYRIDKYTGFRIFVEIIIDKNDIIIYNYNIIENIKEQDIKINLNESNKIITSVQGQIDFLNEKLIKDKNILIDNSFTCINGKGDNLYQCQSDKDINGELKQKGIWDRPCIEDIECPFFKSNKNYINNFGGCIKGTCQMPLGISNIGFHYYTNLNNAICHNCLSNSKNCCKEQLNNNIYPKLKSPDYAFMNDKRMF